MKGYKTVGPPRASQMKLNRNQRENERFLQKQREKKMRQQIKNTVDVVTVGNHNPTSSLQEIL
ncbi:MAG: hypothetical protein LIO69_04730 [Oscillospiraceae bacterium]|nr:hypothetical protein [Oscillospiraceae bacterium]